MNPPIERLSTALATHGEKQSPLRVLVISATFPSGADPFRGVFVKERIKALSELPGFEVRVVAPVPWFPPIPGIAKWSKWADYPKEEVIEGLQVDHPRYPLPPKVGGYLHSELMYPFVARTVRRIHREFKFDVIDSHFVYPSGIVATKLAEDYRVPVVMTGRGEDMLKFPKLPVVGDRIRWALKHATQCIGVSREIADAMLANGSAEDRTSVIANGIDTHKFYPRPMAECRRRLKLPEDRQIVLSVGELIPRKGFELLIEAMPKIIQRHPRALLVIVGRSGRFGRDVTNELHQQIDRLGLQDHVLMPGACPHEELVTWYNAADLFVLMSASEGCPNVLVEAFACGTPAVAASVGGIPDEFPTPVVGHLLQERTSQAAAAKIADALSTTWDRQAIAGLMKARTWESVAIRFGEILTVASTPRT